MRLSRLPSRPANLKHAAHKLTTDLTRRFETIVIENLKVSGMAKNHSLAGALLDCGFAEIRRQLAYKAAMRSGRIVIADRFSPSTQVCSCCGSIAGPKGREELGVEQRCCGECGAAHEREANAAIILEKVRSGQGRSHARGHGSLYLHAQGMPVSHPGKTGDCPKEPRT